MAPEPSGSLEAEPRAVPAPPILAIALCTLLAANACTRQSGPQPVDRPPDQTTDQATDHASNQAPGQSAARVHPALARSPTPETCADTDWRPEVKTVSELGRKGNHNMRFATDGERLVFLSGVSIRSVTMDDDPASVWTERFPGLAGVASVRDGVVYWTESGRFQKPVGTVRMRDPASPQATTLAAGLGNPQSFVVRGRGDVRWLDWQDGGVYRPDGQGGPGVRISSAGSGLWHLATAHARLVTDREHLFFSRVHKGEPQEHDTDAIVRTDWDGHGERILATGQRYVEILAVDASHVYWVADDAIRRIAKGGGTVHELTSVTFPTDLYVHAGFIYYIDNHIHEKTGYSLMRIPSDGIDSEDEVEVLFKSPRTSYMLQRTDDSLYWIEHGRIAGECKTYHTHYPSKSNPEKRHNRSHKVCRGPHDRLLRMDLPRC